MKVSGRLQASTGRKRLQGPMLSARSRRRTPPVSRRWIPQPGGARHEACLGAVGDSELCEDCRDVVANRLLAQEERCGDLSVRPPLGQELEDLEFAGCELGKRLAGIGVTRRREEEPQAVGYLGAEDRLAVRDRPNRPERLFLNRALQLVAARSGADGGEHGFVVIVHRHHEHMDVLRLLEDAPRRVDAVEAGHVDVHDDDIRE